MRHSTITRNSFISWDGIMKKIVWVHMQKKQIFWKIIRIKLKWTICDSLSVLIYCRFSQNFTWKWLIYNWLMTTYDFYLSRPFLFKNLQRKISTLRLQNKILQSMTWEYDSLLIYPISITFKFVITTWHAIKIETIRGLLTIL